MKSGDYEWSRFAAHQAAEKAVKAVFLKNGMDAWGHTISALLGNLPKKTKPQTDLIDSAKILDKHYIPTRCPNGFDSGSPTDFYTLKEAENAIYCAEEIATFCEDQTS